MSQFDEVMAKLDLIIEGVSKVIMILESEYGKREDFLREGREDFLFSQDPDDIQGPPYTEPDYDTPAEEVLKPQMPGVTRRFAEVRTVKGTMKRVELKDLDPYIVRVVEASQKAGAFWMLYERESDGQVMVSAEEHIINQISRGEVPESANLPDLSDTGDTE